jgi:cyd operon protein YbgE
MINALWARVISFCLAVFLSTEILLFPQLFTDETGQPNHGILSLLLIGISAAFVHGIGFRPKPIALALLFSPLFCWPVMLFGLAAAL